MRSAYNLFAGTSIERLAALSDGVFAVALTLLVLDLRPPVAAIASERDLWHALLALGPQLLAYLMTFMTLGIFWLGQQTQLNCLDRTNRDLTWIHLGFLLTITLMPFSTALLAHYITYRLAVGVYWFNILLSGVGLFASWRYARRCGVVNAEVTDEMSAAMERRIVVFQALYALGALLCFINTYWSIAAIVMVQLISVFAPRIRLLYRV